MAEAEAVAREPVVDVHATSGKETRIHHLAAPKTSKAAYWTSFGPNLVWGNQDPIWPLRRVVLNAEATNRLCELAQPKKDHRPQHVFVPEFQYSCGRVSQIWQVSDAAAKRGNATMRLEELARHKSVPNGYLEHHSQFTYSCGRCSPITRPNRRAMSCPERPRTAELAIPKQPHPHYMPGRPVRTVVPSNALAYIASPLIEKLAVPKSKSEGAFRDPEWTIPKATLQANPSERVTELSKPKKLVDGYHPCRDVIWRVSTGAKNAIASNRMTELAKPIIRETMDHVQFNPDVFNVSENAKKAKASARIEELAQPIQRGQ